MNSVRGTLGVTGTTRITGGSTGIIGIQGGYTGLQGYTGINYPGYTGINYPALVPADLEPDKFLEKKHIISRWGFHRFKKVIRYRSKNDCWQYHCPFGPADLDTNEWYINGKKLNDENIKLAQQILDDITIAPLYLNDPILSYPARWVLKYGSEKRDVDELINKTI